MREEKLDGKPPSVALHHPTRIRILEVVNERDMSPVQFLQLGLVKDGSESALSHVSYHFRKLAEDGCLEVVGEARRRGAVEHVYRGRARVWFSDEEWEEVHADERRLLSRAMYQGLAARAEGAMLDDTFDSRDDRHLTWVGFAVDERGWSEAMKALLDCFHRMHNIREEATRRLANSEQRGIPLTVGILGFESSPVAAATPDTAARR